jgi:hypothetical protein
MKAIDQAASDQNELEVSVDARAAAATFKDSGEKYNLAL